MWPAKVIYCHVQAGCVDKTNQEYPPLFTPLQYQCNSNWKDFFQGGGYWGRLFFSGGVLVIGWLLITDCVIDNMSRFLRTMWLGSKYWLDLQEFSPEDFYNQLEEESKVLEKIPDKADITNYVKIKLGLVQAEEPTPDSPEVKYAFHLLLITKYSWRFSCHIYLLLPCVHQYLSNNNLNTNLRIHSWFNYVSLFLLIWRMTVPIPR